MIGCLAPLASMLLVPVVGRTLDRTYRPYGLGAVLALQDLSILASCGVLVAAAARPTSACALVDSPLFWALAALSMAERLASAVSEMAIERDWVPQIAGACVVVVVMELEGRRDRGCVCPPAWCCPVHCGWAGAQRQ